MQHRASVVTAITIVTMLFSFTARAQTSDDEDIAWIEENGFASILFMARCVSIHTWGYVVSTAPLPVGGDWQIACTSHAATAWATTSVQATDGSIHCVLGERAQLSPGGDSRLWIEVLDEGDNQPAQLAATSATPISISPATAFDVAQVWPLWLNAHYDTVDVVPDPLDGSSCAHVFGLD
jgi:hypothetical protein